MLHAALAGAAPRHRQRHHAVPLCDLAGHAPMRPELPLPERVWAHGFVTLAGGERFSKSAGVRVDLAEAIERHRAGRVPLLHAAGGPVRWRRRILLGAVRRAIHGRPRQRLRQPGEPHCRDGRAILRLVLSRLDGRMRSTMANAADYERYREAMDGGRGYLLHEALRQRLAHGRPRQRVRRPPGALEARQRPGAAARARRGPRDPCAPARCARPFTSRPSCPIAPRSCGANSAAPASVHDQRFGVNRARSTRPAGRSSAGTRCFPRATWPADATTTDPRFAPGHARHNTAKSSRVRDRI